MKPTDLNLTLLENSHRFMADAASRALAARDDINQWPFALLSLVQAVELSLKDLLRREHRTLIYRDIEKQRETVSIREALARIENPKLLGITIPEKEKKRIGKAVELRNRITHFEFRLSAEHATAKFSEVFSFLVYFQARHLGVEVETILPPDLWAGVRAVEDWLARLREKAQQRICESDLVPEFIWICPECEEETFVVEEAVCFLCREPNEIVDCPQCNEPCFGAIMEDFSDAIDADWSPGEVYIANSYGYSEFTACPDCIGKIREDIEEQRSQDYHHQMEEEHYWRTKKGH